MENKTKRTPFVFFIQWNTYSCLIFHKRFDQRKKKHIYDVLDGKQRVETILQFIGYNVIDEDELFVNLIDPQSARKIRFSYKELNSRAFRKEQQGVTGKFLEKGIACY